MPTALRKLAARPFDPRRPTTVSFALTGTIGVSRQQGRAEARVPVVTGGISVAMRVARE
jgi:hypothetical protein